MLDSRKIILLGFPLMLGLLTLGVFDMASRSARDACAEKRVAAREKAEKIIARAGDALAGLREKKIAEKIASDKDADVMAGAVADRVAALLEAEASRREVEDSLLRERGASAAGRLLALFAGEKDAPKILAAPLSVISENERRLLKLAGESCEVSVRDTAGKVIWRGGKRPAQSGSVREKQALCSFSWQGKIVSWTVTAYSPPVVFSDKVTLAEAKKAIMADADLRGNLGEKCTLAVFDNTGRAVLSFPENGYGMKSLDGGGLGEWTEINRGAYSGSMMRLAVAKNCEALEGVTLAAQVVNLEEDSLVLVWQELRARPGLLSVPLVGFVVMLGAFASLFGTPKEKVFTDEDIAGRTLVRKDGSDKKLDAAVLLAEFGPKDGEIKLEQIRGGGLEVGRLSSLQRLRQLHCPKGDSFDISASVRSPVLRELLREVGQKPRRGGD